MTAPVVDRPGEPTQPERRAGRIVDVTDLAAFDDLVESGTTCLRGWRVFDVDLTGRTDVLLELDGAGALFAGCLLAPEAVAHLQADGALVYPDVPDLPFEPYRRSTYTADELYAGVADRYESTPDALIYAWSSGPHDLDDAMAIALHDASIDQALDAALAGRPAVGIMGGHAVERGSTEYAAAARLGRALRRAGWTVATGGGPGAMEAANLGSRCATGTDDDLSRTLDRVGRVPSFRPSVASWVTAALDAIAALPAGDGGVGIPTWFYGHEPPNPFASHIAKYFQNSLREATLLRRCDGGIVFLPGAAGTVQEIFQDACENYYADPPMVAPMILVGRTHWTETVPAWPLLQALAAGRPMAPAIALVDTIEDAVERIGVPLTSPR